MGQPKKGEKTAASGAVRMCFLSRKTLFDFVLDLAVMVAMHVHEFCFFGQWTGSPDTALALLLWSEKSKI